MQGVARPPLRLLHAVPFHHEVHVVSIDIVYEHQVVVGAFHPWHFEPAQFAACGGVGVGVFRCSLSFLGSGAVVIAAARCCADCCADEGDERES